MSEYLTALPAFCTPTARERCLEPYSDGGAKSVLRAFLSGLDWDAAGSLIDIYYAGRILVNEQKHLKRRKDSKEIDRAFAFCIQLIMRTVFMTCDRDHKASEFKFTKKEVRSFQDAVDLFEALASWVRTSDVVSAVYKAEDRRAIEQQSSYSLALMGEWNYRLSKQWTRKNGPEDLGLEVGK